MIYPAYEKYEDSGVPWLGEMPKGWSANRLKFSVRLINDKKDHDIIDLPYMGLEHIEPWTGKRTYDESSTSEGVVSLFKIGDVLFGKLRPYLAKVYLAQEDGCSSTEALTLRSGQNLHPKYLQYYMLMPAFINEVDASTYGAKMPRANWDFIGNQLLPLPEFTEQKAIADFLDAKTAEIDALIAKKGELLKLLAEQRTALITNAVAKGLNPNAPAKDSGIDWLGPIPTHWEMKRLKDIVTYNDESLPETTDPAMSIKYVDISSVNLIDGITNVEEFEFEKAPSRARRIVRHGDTIVSTVRTYLKAIAAIRNPEDDLIVSTGFAVVRPRNKVDPEYLGYFLQSQGFIGEVVSKSVGVSYPAINASDLVGIESLLPPLLEQKAIADFLDVKMAEIDALIAKKEELLKLLAEQRAALITNAVTGKIDVRGFQLETILSADVIALPSRNRQSTPAFRRAVFAAKIADRMIGQPTFGRVKFQKILHLSEAHLGIEDIQGNYHRHAAGPHDARMMKSVEGQLQRQRWLTVAQRNANAKVEYKKTDKTDQYLSYFRNYWGDREPEIHEFLDLFSKMNTQQTEIVSTLYAAWNDLLMHVNSATDDQIISEVLNHWHDNKQKIPEMRWRSALGWMRCKGLVPHGAGSRTISGSKA